jgi:hypothetical protein
LAVFAALCLCACNAATDEDASMKAKPQGGDLQADPFFYKRNSVICEVMSGGKPVPGASVTIVATGETFPIGTSGVYVLVLDPAKLGKRPHEIAFKAPGYVEQRRSVLVPEDKQIKLVIELERAP